MIWVLFSWRERTCKKWNGIWTPKYYMWSTTGKHFNPFVFPVLRQQHVYQYMTKLLLYADDSTLFFFLQRPRSFLSEIWKGISFVANGLLTISYIYSWAKQNTISLVRSVNWVTNLQMQCNDHIIKSQTKLK